MTTADKEKRWRVILAILHIFLLGGFFPTWIHQLHHYGAQQETTITPGLWHLILLMVINTMFAIELKREGSRFLWRQCGLYAVLAFIECFKYFTGLAYSFYVISYTAIFLFALINFVLYLKHGEDEWVNFHPRRKMEKEV
ncbi:MAG: hypothetical protein ACYCPQ_05845 [Elusimicrobiota bacterium]